MKNILALFTLLLITTSVFAQANRTEYLLSNANSTAVDTVSNTATKTLTSAIISGSWDAVGVGLAVTKISGTAAGTVKLMGSVDGVNFTQIGTESFTVTDIAGVQGKIFVITPYVYNVIRVSYTGVGTMSAKISATALFKRTK